VPPTKRAVASIECRRTRPVRTSQSFVDHCGGYLAHPFTNQLEVLLIASCFSELWHSQIKEYKSNSRVYLYHIEQTLFIFSFGGS
jgi:hypothetical protein